MGSSLDGIVAVVTGASRGAGRGIAAVLGERGATVYVTGRSTRGGPSAPGRSGSIEETAEEVTRRGGTAVAVRCDHGVDAEIAELFGQVRREHGRLDLLVNNAWGARLAFGFACDLRPHNVAAVAIAPGHLGVNETPEYLGRAVAALACDRDVMKKRSGQTLTVGELAREYGFTDIDGTQPEPFFITGSAED